MIQCKNCGWHEFPKKSRTGTWQFNGDFVKPTFTPSMNECLNPKDSPHHNPEHPERRCHFIITAGQISYCGDCSHDLRNTAMALEPWNETQVKYYQLLKESEGW